MDWRHKDKRFIDEANTRYNFAIVFPKCMYPLSESIWPSRVANIGPLSLRILRDMRNRGNDLITAESLGICANHAIDLRTTTDATRKR